MTIIIIISRLSHDIYLSFPDASLQKDPIGPSRGDASVMHMRGMLRKERQVFDEREEMWRESMRKLRGNHTEREEELQEIIQRDKEQLLSLREILQTLTKPYVCLHMFCVFSASKITIVSLSCHVCLYMYMYGCN
jgi:hypothetical protein